MSFTGQKSFGKSRDFAHLPEFLPENALLVVNNSRVVPARLFGQKPSSGKCELLVLTPPPLLKSNLPSVSLLKDTCDYIMAYPDNPG